MKVVIVLIALMALSCAVDQDESLDGVCSRIVEEEWPKMYLDDEQPPLACYDDPGWGAGEHLRGQFHGVGCCIFESKSPTVRGCFDLWCMIFDECTWDYIDSVCSVGYFGGWPPNAVAEDGYCGETMQECKDLQ